MLDELWQQVLINIHIPSRRALLHQMGRIVSFDGITACVAIKGTWVDALRSDVPALEEAFRQVLQMNVNIVMISGATHLWQRVIDRVANPSRKAVLAQKCKIKSITGNCVQIFVDSSWINSVKINDIHNLKAILSELLQKDVEVTLESELTELWDKVTKLFNPATRELLSYLCGIIELTDNSAKIAVKLTTWLNEIISESAEIEKAFKQILERDIKVNLELADSIPLPANYIESDNDTEYVYLARTGDTDLYKIGKSKQPDKRIAHMKTANPLIKLIHKIPSSKAGKLEKTLHHHYSSYHFDGEWFSFPPDIEQGFLHLVVQLNSGQPGIHFVDKNSNRFLSALYQVKKTLGVNIVVDCDRDTKGKLLVFKDSPSHFVCHKEFDLNGVKSLDIYLTQLLTDCNTVTDRQRTISQKTTLPENSFYGNDVKDASQRLSQFFDGAIIQPTEEAGQDSQATVYRKYNTLIENNRRWNHEYLTESDIFNVERTDISPYILDPDENELEVMRDFLQDIYDQAYADLVSDTTEWWYHQEDYEEILSVLGKIEVRSGIEISLDTNPDHPYQGSLHMYSHDVFLGVEYFDLDENANIELYFTNLLACYSSYF